MGYLDHSTNTILIDAVLTDTGRRFLARNDGSFSIVKFSFGDDEIDYGIIRQFGRTIGQEKIEKNTPVLEAITNPAFAQKYKMISVSNPNLIRLPTLTLTGEGLTSNVLSMGISTNKQRTLTVFQSVSGESAIDVELVDQTFVVRLNNSFLEVVGEIPDSVDVNGVSYIMTRNDRLTGQGGGQISFTLRVKSISDSQFTIFGSTQNKNLIRSYVRVQGLQSGQVYEFEVQISKTS